MRRQGFVVCSKYGPLGLGEARVLWIENYTTMFETRPDARNSIARTRRYARRHNYNSDAWIGHFIKPVVLESEEERL